MKIEVLACDVDRRVPALTYTLTASDGRTVTADLCAVHSEAIERLFQELGMKPLDTGSEGQVIGEVQMHPASPATAEPDVTTPGSTSRDSTTEPEVPDVASTLEARPAAPAKKARGGTAKTPAKKAAAKQTSTPRRTRGRARFATLEEIEAKKQEEQ
ncbi:hypothetical protein [Streptodolium elevatio]|uniref:Uncharacterized protein n=1 Tax=Streptodolium elevatio TaxID=3157996 RepID=A0ABV3DBU0_9ACTN